MSLSDNFCQFFDKVNSRQFVFYTGSGPWKIHESDKSAKVTDLEISGDNLQFVGFGQKLTKNMSCLTINRSNLFKDKECDGIAFVKKAEKEDLLFVEIKSKYDSNPVLCAVLQMCISFLKMHTMLSLCSNYILDNIDICFLIVTGKAENDNEEAKVKVYASQAEQSEKSFISGKLLRDLLYEGKSKITIGDLLKDNKMYPYLHNDIKSKCIKVQLVTTSDSNSAKALYVY